MDPEPSTLESWLLYLWAILLIGLCVFVGLGLYHMLIHSDSCRRLTRYVDDMNRAGREGDDDAETKAWRNIHAENAYQAKCGWIATGAAVVAGFVIWALSVELGQYL